MKEKPLVKEENKIKILFKMFWSDEPKEIEEVAEIDNIDKDVLKELELSSKRLKVLEDNYGIEPKDLKNAKKKSPAIKKATMHRSVKEQNVKNNNKEQEKDNGKIQEI